MKARSKMKNLIKLYEIKDNLVYKLVIRRMYCNKQSKDRAVKNVGKNRIVGITSLLFDFIEELIILS